jgi:competence protein ComEA
MFKNLRLILFGIFTGLLAAALILLLNQRRTATPIKLMPPPPTEVPQPIKVHVTGAVKNAGVHELPPGSILKDAITAAGGATDSAALDKMNLAAKLNDGQQIVVGESVTAASANSITQPSNNPSPSLRASPTAFININTATLEQLQTLPKIGAVTAQRIVEYRTKNGPFARIEDIQKVTGIGDATYATLAPLITVK